MGSRNTLSRQQSAAASAVAADAVRHDDSRLSDARTPTAHVHAGTDISTGTVPYARLPVGTATSTVAAGDDSRLTNARTPTAHAATHATGQSDALSPAAIGAATTTHTHADAISTKTAAYTILDTDRVIIGNTSTAGFTVTLPTAVGRSGVRFLIKKMGGSNPLTIASNGGTIDGGTSEVISMNQGFREVISDGTNWYICGGKVDPVIVSVGSIAAAGTWTIDASAGTIYRASAAGSTMTLAVPTNPIDADQINVEILASVATTITFNASILLTSGITATVDVAIGKRWFGGLRWVSGVGWFLLASTVQS